MKKYILGILLALAVCLTGCSTSSNERATTNVRKDIDVKDATDRYYNEQTLIIPINNGYRYTNVVQEFNEETQEYIITIIIFKPLKPLLKDK